jgi:hypothetical protein
MRKAKNVNYISFHSEMEQYEAKYKVIEAKLSEAKNLMLKEAQKPFILLQQANKMRNRSLFASKRK